MAKANTSVRFKDLWPPSLNEPLSYYEQVKALTEKIKELEQRVKALEDKEENNP
jgi:polyhydroxyalkanoate synthesis regulator phasin